MDVEFLQKDGPRQSWVVLIVDDEPDVHKITELILADVYFSSAPVVLKSVFSAQQAKSILATQADIALVLLDVVMETNDSGLSLTRYIREELHNEDVQIILRTGQPGHAPEQEVIQNYSINGYFLKTDITAQRLRSIVISALRTYQHIGNIRRTKRPYLDEKVSQFPLKQRKRLCLQLSEAVVNRQVDFLAQPRIRLSDDTVVGIELKPIWKISTHQVLQFYHLTSIVEDSESLYHLNDYLLREGSVWSKRWYQAVPDLMKVTVPIVADGVNNERLFTMLQRRLIELNLPHGLLGFELSESMLLSDYERVIQFAEHLKSLGVSMTIADFGMGLTSLLQLKRLQLHSLKIHHWLVRNIVANSEQSAVARSIIALAHTMEVDVIADGITTQNEFQFFKWEGCDLGQGDFIAKAIPAKKVSELLIPQRTITH